jgi:hypothetical protein
MFTVKHDVFLFKQLIFKLLLPQSGIGYCCTMIARAEKQKIGTWENLHMILLTGLIKFLLSRKFF